MLRSTGQQLLCSDCSMHFSTVFFVYVCVIFRFVLKSGTTNSLLQPFLPYLDPPIPIPCRCFCKERGVQLLSRSSFRPCHGEDGLQSDHTFFWYLLLGKRGTKMIKLFVDPLKEDIRWMLLFWVSRILGTGKRSLFWLAPWWLQCHTVVFDGWGWGGKGVGGVG